MVIKPFFTELISCAKESFSSRIPNNKDKPAQEMLEKVREKQALRNPQTP